MLDINNIPNQSGDNVKIYYAQSGSNSWQTWQKPRGSRYVWMMCIGAGGGGQCGTGSCVFNIQSTSVGGGSATTTIAIFPANVLPDTLYILVPTGSGPSATPFAYPPSPSRTFVSIAPNTTIINTVCVSGASAPSGQSAGTILTAANYTSHAGLLSLGIFQGIVGQVGGAFTTENRTGLVGALTMGGCAGGPSSGSVSGPFAGGGSVTGVVPYLPSIPAGTLSSPNGNNGYFSLKPLILTSGTGGYGYDLNPPGNGGNGAYGCGGGGGGSTTVPGIIGGLGGKGGDGLVIIATF